VSPYRYRVATYYENLEKLGHLKVMRENVFLPVLCVIMYNVVDSTVPDMTYNVFGGMLSLTPSLVDSMLTSVLK